MLTGLPMIISLGIVYGIIRKILNSLGLGIVTKIAGICLINYIILTIFGINLLDKCATFLLNLF